MVSCFQSSFIKYRISIGRNIPLLAQKSWVIESYLMGDVILNPRGKDGLLQSRNYMHIWRFNKKKLLCLYIAFQYEENT